MEPLKHSDLVLDQLSRPFARGSNAKGDDSISMKCRKALTRSVLGIFVAMTLAACNGAADGTRAANLDVASAIQTDGAFVQTDLGQLFVKETGQGDTTVVLWPSIFTDHQIYDGLTDELAGTYRFLLIDGPGHGRSDGPTSEFTTTQSASAMAAVLDHYDVEKAVVGGTSWGGLAAAELALAQPDRVEALILMNTPMEIDARRPGLSARFIAWGARYGLGSAVFRNGVARNFFTAEVLEGNPAYAASFHEMLKNADARALSTAVRSVILKGSPLKDRMGDITVPTLVIAGENDAMYPLEAQRAAAAMLAHGEFAPVKGKHISVVEQPQPVARLVDGFIRRTAGKRN